MPKPANQSSSTRDAEFFCFSNFIGSLERLGKLDEDAAAVMLVGAFWENERRKAWDEGIDLTAQVAERMSLVTGVA